MATRPANRATMLLKWLSGTDAIGPRVARFMVVGGASTIAYGVFTLAAIQIARLPPLLATVVGYGLVIPLNFVLQRNFTFRSKNETTREIPRFLLVHGMNMAASLATMLVVDKGLGLDPRWGIVATMVLVPALVFVAMDNWVFRRTKT